MFGNLAICVSVYFFCIEFWQKVIDKVFEIADYNFNKLKWLTIALIKFFIRWIIFL